MAEGAKLIEGADLAVSFQELLKKIIEMIKKAQKSRFRLQIFRLILKDSTSLVEDIKHLNDHFDQPREEIEKLIQEKKAGHELVGSQSRKIRFWKFLVKCLSFNMVRAVKETLKEVREILKDNSRHEITCSPAQNTEIAIGMEEPWLRLKMEVLKDGASTLELTGLPGSGKTTQSTIWKFVGGVSAITGLVCFALSSSYDMSFGELGHVSYFVLPLVCLIICLPIVVAKRIRVSERVQAVMAALIFVVICVISVLHDDKLVTRKLDALSIISYGSFALMSLSVSRNLELGFETCFSVFFLQLFASQLFKIKRFLLAIALVFCSLIIILRYYSVRRSTVWF
ncbi:hypothetical protein QN277_028671 [Acacia crassicarpa]|uniref:RPW8 domain-containing protein n=1 Tax=Acacia crassicarpa TaxID=499986 RepID=A0AAE1MDE1_9FABA|nr:hypothetical protein QN277_028671 [Acacia crassicarpa]